MKKITITMLLIVSLFSESGAMHAGKAAIHRVDVYNAEIQADIGNQRKFTTLLVVDLPTTPQVRVFLYNGQVSTDLRHFRGSFKCPESEKCGGTSLLNTLIIDAFDPWEPVILRSSGSQQTLMQYGYIQPRSYGPLIEIQDALKWSFGVREDDIRHSSAKVDLSLSRNYIDFENHVNVLEIISRFPLKIQEEFEDDLGDSYSPMPGRNSAPVFSSNDSISDSTSQLPVGAQKGRPSKYWRSFLVRGGCRSRHPGKGKRHSKLSRLQRSASHVDLVPSLKVPSPEKNKESHDLRSYFDIVETNAS
jgi:hypothetical protein